MKYLNTTQIPFQNTLHKSPITETTPKALTCTATFLNFGRLSVGTYFGIGNETSQVDGAVHHAVRTVADKETFEVIGGKSLLMGGEVSVLHSEPYVHSEKTSSPLFAFPEKTIFADVLEQKCRAADMHPTDIIRTVTIPNEAFDGIFPQFATAATNALYVYMLEIDFDPIDKLITSTDRPIEMVQISIMEGLVDETQCELTITEVNTPSDLTERKEVFKGECGGGCRREKRKTRRQKTKTKTKRRKRKRKSKTKGKMQQQKRRQITRKRFTSL